ncbi:MAG: hypothetical protein QNL62_12390 [Gammaproteobacteria bacterium]|nr:hypothetical protein [Gammaproteobacteria bacterium]
MTEYTTNKLITEEKQAWSFCVIRPSKVKEFENIVAKKCQNTAAALRENN